MHRPLLHRLHRHGGKTRSTALPSVAIVIAAGMCLACNPNDPKEPADDSGSKEVAETKPEPNPGQSSVDDVEILVPMGLTGFDFLADADAAAARGTVTGPCARDQQEPADGATPEEQVSAAPAALAADTRCVLRSVRALTGLIGDESGLIAKKLRPLAAGASAMIDLEAVNPTFEGQEPVFARVARLSGSEPAYEVAFLTVGATAGTLEASTVVTITRGAGADLTAPASAGTTARAATSEAGRPIAAEILHFHPQPGGTGRQRVQIAFESTVRRLTAAIGDTDTAGAPRISATRPSGTTVDLAWDDGDTGVSLFSMLTEWDRTPEAAQELAARYYPDRLKAGDLELAQLAGNGAHSVQRLAFAAAESASGDLATAAGAATAFDSLSYDRWLRRFVVQEVITNAAVHADCATFGTVLTGRPAPLPANLCGDQTAHADNIWGNLATACAAGPLTITVALSGGASSGQLDLCEYAQRGQLVKNPRIYAAGTDGRRGPAAADAADQTDVAALLARLAGAGFANQPLNRGDLPDTLEVIDSVKASEAAAAP